MGVTRQVWHNSECQSDHGKVDRELFQSRARLLSQHPVCISNAVLDELFVDEVTTGTSLGEFGEGDGLWAIMEQLMSAYFRDFVNARPV